MGFTWTNPDQVMFLNNQLIEFVKAQNSKTLTAFWMTVWCDFFVQWLTPDSEFISNGLDPSWNGTQKTNKKKAHKTEETVILKGKVNSTDANTSKWMGLHQEVFSLWYQIHALMFI